MRHPRRFRAPNARAIPIASPNLSYTSDNPAITQRRAEDDHRVRQDAARRQAEDHDRLRQIDEITAQTILESIPEDGGAVDPRKASLDAARRMASSNIGGPAMELLQSVAAGDSAAADERDQRFEQVLKIAADGDPGTAQALAQQYGVNIPPQILANGKVAHAMSMAKTLYGSGNEDQAGLYVKEVMANGGDWQAAYRRVGPARQKPQTPKGTVKTGSDGRPYWMPHGGGEIAPFTGATGVTFPAGGSGQTDPAVAAKRAHDAAAGYADATVGPQDTLYDEDLVRWQQAYTRRLGEIQQMRGGAAPPTAAPVNPAPPPVPNLSNAMSATPPPPEAVKELTDNPSPRAIAEFDEVFGEGAAEAALRAEGMLGEED